MNSVPVWSVELVLPYVRHFPLTTRILARLGPGDLSPASHRGESYSVPVQAMLDLQWTNWCSDRYQYDCVSIILPVLQFHLYNLIN